LVGRSKARIDSNAENISSLKAVERSSMNCRGGGGEEEGRSGRQDLEACVEEHDG